MLTLKKTGVSLLLVILALIAGFIFLIKGCLAKYDERFAKTPALHFTINGRNIIFAIVEYQRAVSYSRQGGFVRKSVNTSYYLQTNDGSTAELIKLEKIKKGSAIKNYPVEILGSSGNNAWLFMNESMAFNALTLEKVADIDILGQKNPSLKGLFPAERQYYTFDRQNQNLYLTAKDGSKWMIDTKTLLAKQADYSKETAAENSIENEILKTRRLLDSLYQQKNYRPSRDYSAKRIDAAAYKRITAEFYRERELLDTRLDSLQNVQRNEEKSKRNTDDLKRKIESLQNTNISFPQCRANHDVTGDRLFMLCSDEEADKIEERYWDRSLYDETARRNLFSGQLVLNRWKDMSLEKAGIRKLGNHSFLDGGFLLDKQTALPIKTKDDKSWLVVHKSIVGKEGDIMLTSLKEDGTTAWTVNTSLPQWNDWIYSGDHLCVFGVDNEELSSSECNLLLCINLLTGTYSSYDYFLKKVVKK